MFLSVYLEPLWGRGLWFQYLMTSRHEQTLCTYILKMLFMFAGMLFASLRKKTCDDRFVCKNVHHVLFTRPEEREIQTTKQETSLQPEMSLLMLTTFKDQPWLSAGSWRNCSGRGSQIWTRSRRRSWIKACSGTSRTTSWVHLLASAPSTWRWVSICTNVRRC